jgi:hypothetical protein
MVVAVRTSFRIFVEPETRIFDLRARPGPCCFWIIGALLASQSLVRLRVCSPRGNRSTVSVRKPHLSTTPTLLVSPPHWSNPLHVALESSLQSQLLFGASTLISFLQTVSSPSTHSKSNPSTFRICPPLTVTDRARPLLDVPGDVCSWSRLMAKLLIPTFLWNLCERSFYIALNRII